MGRVACSAATDKPAPYQFYHRDPPGNPYGVACLLNEAVHKAFGPGFGGGLESRYRWRERGGGSGRCDKCRGVVGVSIICELGSGLKCWLAN